MASPQVVKRWIVAVCDQLGISKSELVRRAGLNTTTVTKFFQAGSDKAMRLSTLRKLADASGVKLPADIDPAPPPPRDLTDLALEIADQIPVGRPLTPTDRHRVTREILALFARAQRRAGG